MIDEIPVDERMTRHIRTVGDLKSRGRRTVLLGVQSCREGRFVFNPAAEFALEINDMLVVIAEHAMLREFRASLHRKERA